MRIKAWLILSIIALLVIGAKVFPWGNRRNDVGDASGLIVGNNAIYVAEQLPGLSVSINLARLQARGFVAIHEDNKGEPGKILGASKILEAGEAKDPRPIGLSRKTRDGETLYAMIHLDDGDGLFDPEKDKAATDALSGEPIMMIFVISSDAIEPGAVSL